MVPLLQPLQLEDKDGAPCLVLWLCESFDWSYSFRGALSRIQQALGGEALTSWRLPAEVPSEDFVEGGFVWLGRSYSLYFERSLGYMQFSSVLLGDVQALQAALSPNISIERTGPGKPGPAAHVKR